MNHIAVPGSIAAIGYHAPLEIALPLIVAVVVLKVLVSRVRGRPAVAGKLVVRCGKGHVFTTTWSSLGSLASVRLGVARFQRCPVGHHWSLVRLANDSDSDLAREDARFIDRGRR